MPKTVLDDLEALAGNTPMYGEHQFATMNRYNEKTADTVVETAILYLAFILPP